MVRHRNAFPMVARVVPRPHAVPDLYVCFAEEIGGSVTCVGPFEAVAVELSANRKLRVRRV